MSTNPKTRLAREILALALAALGFYLLTLGNMFGVMIVCSVGIILRPPSEDKRPRWSGSKMEWTLLFVIPIASAVIIWLVLSGHIFAQHDSSPVARKTLPPLVAAIAWLAVLASVVWSRMSDRKQERSLAGQEP